MNFMQRLRTSGAICTLGFSFGICVLSTLLAAPAWAGAPGGGFIQLEFDTELTALNLAGPTIPMPLASDPGNALGDSVSGYGFVDSQVSITLSSQRLPMPGPASLGHAFATPKSISDAGTASGDGAPDPEPIDPSEWDGEEFQVYSFFDVFFDITVTDVDARAGRNFAGMPDGASVQFLDNGPSIAGGQEAMQTFYTAIFDMDAPNFGLIPPPEVSPYIGHFQIEIPLGGDINGNGEPDKIKFSQASHAVGDENRTFIVLPDGTVIDSFDSTAQVLGAVVDVSTDPPFEVLLSGPSSASSNLLNPVVPEPSSLVLLAAGGLLAAARRRNSRR